MLTPQSQIHGFQLLVLEIMAGVLASAWLHSLGPKRLGGHARLSGALSPLTSPRAQFLRLQPGVDQYPFPRTIQKPPSRALEEPEWIGQIGANEASAGASPLAQRNRPWQQPSEDYGARGPVMPCAQSGTGLAHVIDD